MIKTRLLPIIICAILGCLGMSAIPEKTSHEKSKTVLIINSYSEASPWSRSMVSPVSLYVANDKNLHAEMFSLNNVLITDSLVYNQVVDNLFLTFKDKKPDYLVMIGALAFTLRDRVKAEWGDIPMLVISRDLTLAPLNYYFAGFDAEPDKSDHQSVSQLQKEYNFTAIYVPDLYKETIDLMVKLKPGMTKLAFLSDCILLNRNMARDIEYYLYEYHPEIKFRWVQASGDRPDELQEYLVNDLPDTGILLSTWLYEKRNAFGYPALVTGDLNLLNSSKNPIFTTREPNIGLGAIGGVFVNQDSIRDQINTLLGEMVSGKRLSDIRIKVNKHDYSPIINYAKLKEYGLNPNDCPKDTKFLDRPLTFREKYLWQMIATIAIFCLTIMLFLRHAKAQRKEIETLERHRKFVDKMPVPFSKAKIIYNDQGEVINIKYALYNDAFDHLLKDNALKKGPFMLFPKDFISEKVNQLIANKSVVNFKYHFDRTDTYYVFTICFVDDHERKNGEHNTELDIFATDVTKRQKTEDMLKRTTHKLDMTLNVAHLIPWEWDIERDTLKLDTVNLFQRATLDFEQASEQHRATNMSGQEYISLINPDDRLEIAEYTNRLRRGEIKGFKTEHRIRATRDGRDTEEWVEVNGTVSDYDERGKPKIVSGSLLIITDRKRQEQELIDAREKATESDKLKSAFLANMSHEIRTPLNAIVGFSSLMCETDDREKRQEFADIIIHNNDMLLSLVNDVLDLAKIESNSMMMFPTTINLNNLLNTVCQTIQTRVHNGVTLNLVEGLPSCTIVIDGNRLSQVLMNLLTNAAKFTTKGSITFGYDLVDNKELYFYVKDTGIGVSAENQSRLFTRFDKINNFIQGNGLGLSICKSIVEKLGGTIGMKSRGEGKGSTFWFTIPYTPGDEQNIGKPQELTMAEEDFNKEDTPIPATEGKTPAVASKETTIETAQKVQPPTPSTDNKAGIETPAKAAAAPKADVKEDKVTADDKPSAEAKEQTILIAEDMEGNFLLLSHLLPKHYKILHAWDGQEAVTMYTKLRPDIVMMDISMPIMDGYQATQEIRKISDTVPIIAVTAFAYASDRQRILRSGFNDYISKPVNRDELLEALKRIKA